MMIKELLWLSDYEIVNVWQSRVDPTKTVYERLGFYCPNCRREHLVKETHGYETQCNCGMIMRSSGNALHCEISEHQLCNTIVDVDAQRESERDLEEQQVNGWQG